MSISSVSTLADKCGADSLAKLGKYFYDITECGVGTEFTTMDKSYQYTDDYYGISKPLPNIWAGKVVGIKFHTIVEGSDAEFSCDLVTFPCEYSEIQECLDYLEGESTAAFEEDFK
tara:strand:- start:131 stop:478 length:348 start_codon:yes stop_codon:yes gene_type:complete